MEGGDAGFRTPPQAQTPPFGARSLEDDDRITLEEEDLVPVSVDEVDMAVTHLKQLGTRMLALGKP